LKNRFERFPCLDCILIGYCQESCASSLQYIFKNQKTIFDLINQKEFLHCFCCGKYLYDGKYKVYNASPHIIRETCEYCSSILLINHKISIEIFFKQIQTYISFSKIAINILHNRSFNFIPLDTKEKTP